MDRLKEIHYISKITKYFTMITLYQKDICTSTEISFLKKIVNDLNHYETR